MIDWLWLLVGVIIGGLAGFFISRQMMKSYVKKINPIDENVVRQMYTAMGQKPNEKKIKQIVKQMNK